LSGQGSFEQAMNAGLVLGAGLTGDLPTSMIDNQGWDTKDA